LAANYAILFNVGIFGRKLRKLRKLKSRKFKEQKDLIMACLSLAVDGAGFGSFIPEADVSVIWSRFKGRSDMDTI